MNAVNTTIAQLLNMNVFMLHHVYRISGCSCVLDHGSVVKLKFHRTNTDTDFSDVPIV